MASEYKPAFRREGVLHEIEIIADQQLTSKPKEPEPVQPDPSGEPVLPLPSVVNLSPTKRSSSHVLDPQDAVTLRARVVRFKYLNGTVELEDAVFAQLRSLVRRISSTDATEGALKQSLQEIADLFASASTSVSSFELLQSGLVDGLLEFATVKERARGLFDFAFSYCPLTPFRQLNPPAGNSYCLRPSLSALLRVVAPPPRRLPLPSSSRNFKRV